MLDSGPSAYRLAIEEGDSYLHAKASGPRNPQNALRFLKESYEACEQRGHDALILEMDLSGPSLDAGSIYAIISQRTPEGAKLRRIAYVDSVMPELAKARFAETVAVNRGVNVRLFRELASAREWITRGETQ